MALTKKELTVLAVVVTASWVGARMVRPVLFESPAAPEHPATAEELGHPIETSTALRAPAYSGEAGRQAVSGIGRTGKPAPGAAIFPDGTWLPPLNGVKAAPPFPGFPGGHPYSPVVRVETNPEGFSWYVHADGTHSNTQMCKQTENGVTTMVAGWAVGREIDSMPVRREPR